MFKLTFVGYVTSLAGLVVQAKETISSLQIQISCDDLFLCCSLPVLPHLPLPWVTHSPSGTEQRRMHLNASAQS